jgi:hypothetical protein
MNEKDPLKNISNAILDFPTSNKIVGFEKYVLDNLHDNKEIELFNDIWLTTINIDNWNFKSIQVGYNNTIDALKSKYNLDEQVCKFLANIAAYQWK